MLRDHNDVIEFNCCDGLLTRPNGATPMRVKIRSKKCLSPGISMKKKIHGNDIEYEVSVYRKYMISMRPKLNPRLIGVYLVLTEVN